MITKKETLFRMRYNNKSLVCGGGFYRDLGDGASV